MRAAARLGITRVGALSLLQLLTAYLAATGGCLLWQRLTAPLKGKK